MTETIEFVLGGSERERLLVQLNRRERPDALDASDGNWIVARVELAVGGFRVEFGCSLRAEDFADLLPQLRQLQNDPAGCAEFITTEDQLGFRIQGDGRGHLSVRGHVLDRRSDGNRLDWSLQLDQTYLPRIISAAAEITDRYEVRGR